MKSVKSVVTHPHYFLSPNPRRPASRLQIVIAERKGNEDRGSLTSLTLPTRRRPPCITGALCKYASLGLLGHQLRGLQVKVAKPTKNYVLGVVQKIHLSPPKLSGAKRRQVGSAPAAAQYLLIARNSPGQPPAASGQAGAAGGCP